MTAPIVTGPAAAFLPPGLEAVLLHCGRPMVALRLLEPAVFGGQGVHYGCQARDCTVTVDVEVRGPQ